MALEFDWDPNIFYIIPMAVWLFRSAALIIWAKNTKKHGSHTKHINFLQIIGVFMLAWDIISFFLPSVRFSYFPFPSEAEIMLFNLIYFTYSFIPDLIFFLLLIALMLYIKKNFAIHNKKTLIGPALLLAGASAFLFLLLNEYFLFLFFNPIYEVLYEVYSFAYLIARFALIAGGCLLLLFSIRLNRDFFMMFTSLLLASIIVAFLFRINYLAWRFA